MGVLCSSLKHLPSSRSDTDRAYIFTLYYFKSYFKSTDDNILPITIKAVISNFCENIQEKNKLSFAIKDSDTKTSLNGEDIKDQLENLYQNILNSMNEVQKKILLCYISGLDPKETSSFIIITSKLLAFFMDFTSFFISFPEFKKELDSAKTSINDDNIFMSYVITTLINELSSLPANQHRDHLFIHITNYLLDDYRNRTDEEISRRQIDRHVANIEKQLGEEYDKAFPDNITFRKILNLRVALNDFLTQSSLPINSQEYLMIMDGDAYALQVLTESELCIKYLKMMDEAADALQELWNTFPENDCRFNEGIRWLNNIFEDVIQKFLVQKFILEIENRTIDKIISAASKVLDQRLYKAMTLFTYCKICLIIKDHFSHSSIEEKIFNDFWDSMQCPIVFFKNILPYLTNLNILIPNNVPFGNTA
ncbi:MAG: hypothetical protein KBD37_00755, partial [Burkholderiales bacterium]|nr:hypothetical protein [Burkholderiales bacterium]